MPVKPEYLRRVKLLRRILPHVATEECFALKGGTAINLFVRDMPRLSVDIDLIYLPKHARPDALAGIDAAMTRIADAIRTEIPDARVANVKIGDAIVKLNVRADDALVKVEVTPVLRGTVHEPTFMQVRPVVDKVFGSAEIHVASFADLYAGKLVAALDRQHPRDLFDVHVLLRHEGITRELREAFLVYLISHNRPMGQVVSGRRKDIAQLYETAFVGITNEPVQLDTLLSAQKDMIASLIGGMPERHRRFLLGFERRETDWSLLHVPHAKDLPAVRWRELNLDKCTSEKRSELVSLLEKALERHA